MLRLHTAECVSGRSPPQVRHSGPTAGIAADGQDVALVRVEVTDAAGRFVPDASDHITFSVTGPGRIYGVGNGDPTDHDPDKATVRAHPGRLSALSGRHSDSVWYGAFAWVRRALSIPTRWFPTRAVS